MKKKIMTLIALLLAAVMTMSTFTFTSWAVTDNVPAAEGTVKTDNTDEKKTGQDNAADEKQAGQDNSADQASGTGDVKDSVEQDIFQNRDDSSVDVSGYNMTKKELSNVTDDVLEENSSSDLVGVTYETGGDGTVSTMNVEMDDELSTSLDELDAINEASDEPLSNDEMQTVYQHYAELQSYYEANPDYFGIACPYFTSKDTEASPIGAILSIAGIPQESIGTENGPSIQDVDNIILGFSNALPQYVQYMGDALFAARDQALAQLDDNMSDLEKLMVLSDWLGNWCNFDMSAIMDDQNSGSSSDSGEQKDTLIGSTAFGALVNRKCVCMGYTAAYTYLVQCAFPEIYKESDGTTWKTKAEVNGQAAVEDDPSTEANEAKDAVEATYMVDFVRINWDADVTMLGEDSHFDQPHFFNAVKLDGKWYYLDSCYDDISVECMDRNRVETDGNMTHMYFLCSDNSMRQWYDGNFSSIDTLYEDLADNDEYEDAWFADATGPIYYDDNYWYYVKNTSTYSNSSFEQKPDQMIARPRSLTDAASTDGEIKLLDYETGEGTTTGGTAVSSALAKDAYSTYEAYSDIYPELVHSIGLYNNVIYFSTGSQIMKYDLDSGDISLLKEYNKVSAVQDTSNEFTGMSYTVAADGTDGIVHTVYDHPIAALCIKDDGKMYVQIATDFCYASDYTVEEANYNPDYVNYGSYQSGGDNDNQEFMWSANFVDTMDMSHVAGDEHSFEAVTVAPTCGRQGYTENRCSVCGISEGTERTDLTDALDHHFVKMHDEYYTKDDDGNRISADVYVCVRCLKSEDTLAEGESAEHTYGAPKFKWSDDYSTCDAVFTCSVCDGTQTAECACSPESTQQTVACEVTSDVSEGKCTDARTADYTAKCSFMGQDYTETKNVTLPAGDHSYAAPVFNWTKTGDGYSCDAVFTCSKGDDTQTVACKVTSTVGEGKCTEERTITYTAACTFQNKKYSEAKTDTLSAGSHSYGAPEYKWTKNGSGYSCEAVFKCSAGDDTQTAACTVKSQSSGGSCTVGSKTVYTASCTFQNKTYEDKKEVTAAAPGHKYKYTSNGNDTHTAICAVCGAKTTETCSFDGSKCTKCGAVSILTKQTVALGSLGNDNGGVTVKWSALSGADSYKIYRRTGGSGWKLIAQVSAVSYTDKEVKSGSTYTYTVKAVKKSISSKYNGTGLTVRYLSKAGIKSAYNTASGIKMKWNKVSGASGYYVYRKAGSASSWSLAATVRSGKTLSWTDKKVSNGSRYTYCVRAYSGKFRSVSSYKVKTRYRLGSPAISSLKNSASGKAAVKWSKNKKADGYVIQYSAYKSFKKAQSVTAASDETLTISGLKKNKTYYVRVRSYKLVSGTKYYSAWSSAAKLSIK